MSKRLQISLNEDSWSLVEQITKDACENFESGSINYSDVINEMILNSKVDIKLLQLKHTDVRRSLRVMAGKDDIDIDTIIKNLMDLKGKSKKTGKQLQLTGDRDDEKS